jgi:hypothetical protein
VYSFEETARAALKKLSFSSSFFFAISYTFSPYLFLIDKSGQ